MRDLSPETLRDQLESFNAYRRALLAGVPPDPHKDRMPIERSGVGGDVEEPE